VRTPAFWLMTGAYSICGFTDFLITTHLAPFAADLGLSPSAGANAISLLAAANIAGILVSGQAANLWGPRGALVATYLLRTAAFCCLILVDRTWQLYLFAVLFGATFFTTAPLTATLVRESFGPANQGMIFGLTNMFHHLSSAIGSYAGGRVFDLAHSYRSIFALSTLLVLLAAALQWAAARKSTQSSGLYSRRTDG
jgi:MFS family permease